MGLLITNFWLRKLIKNKLIFWWLELTDFLKDNIDDNLIEV